jgi:hypothetical protein
VAGSAENSLQSLASKRCKEINKKDEKISKRIIFEIQLIGFIDSAVEQIVHEIDEEYNRDVSV